MYNIKLLSFKNYNDQTVFEAIDFKSGCNILKDLGLLSGLVTRDFQGNVTLFSSKDIKLVLEIVE